MIVHRKVRRRHRDGHTAVLVGAATPTLYSLPRPRLGLGDAAEWVAKPLARWIDARLASADPVLAMAVLLPVRAGWVKLPLAGCSACSARRRILNAWLPDIRSWRAWAGLLQRLIRSLAKPRKSP